MGRVWTGFLGECGRFYSDAGAETRLCARAFTLGVAVSDVLYVALTIVVFALLFLLVKGVERLER
jgi:hypothetical protein